MRLSYQYGTERIEFDVTFRKRKTLSIEVGKRLELSLLLLQKEELKKKFFSL